VKALDLCCAGGGVTKGLQQMGYQVTGVDIQPQPRYCGDEFILGDMLTIMRRLIDTGAIEQYSFIHSSPPCQEWSNSTLQWRKQGRTYPNLIKEIRQLLRESGKPYSIENGQNAPLINPVTLCGCMFGLMTYRPRNFETSFPCDQPAHNPHTAPQTKMGRPPKAGEFIQVVGHFSNVALAQRAMEIDWLGQKELAQAIPPAYMRYIVGQYHRATQ